MFHITLNELLDMKRYRSYVLNARKFSETCNAENFQKIVMESIRAETAMFNLLFSQYFHNILIK